MDLCIANIVCYDDAVAEDFFSLVKILPTVCSEIWINISKYVIIAQWPSRMEHKTNSWNGANLTQRTNAFILGLVVFSFVHPPKIRRFPMMRPYEFMYCASFIFQEIPHPSSAGDDLEPLFSIKSNSAFGEWTPRANISSWFFFLCLLPQNVL